MSHQTFKIWQKKLQRFCANFNSLSIHGKLSFGFGSLVTLTFLVVALSNLGSIKARQNITLTQTVRVPTALTSADAQTNLLKMASNVRGYLATGNSEFRDLFQQSRQKFEADLAYLDALLLNNQDAVNAQRLQELRTLYGQWSSLPDRLFLLRNDPIKNQPALALLSQQGEAPISTILTEMTQLIQEQEQQGITSDNLLLVKALVDFKSTFSLQVAALRGYLATRTPSFRFDYTVHAKASHTAWTELQKYQGLMPPSQQSRLQKIAQARQQLQPLPEAMFAAVESKRNREDLFLFQTQAEPLAEQMLVLLEDLVKSEQASLTAELMSSNQGLTVAQAQTIVASVITLLVAATLVLILRQQIANPIKRLTEATSRIAQGDLEAKAVVETHDEIGVLAATFNKMTNSLKQSQEKLKEYSYTLEQRVESRTLELQQKNDQLRETLQSLHQAQAQLVQTEKMSSLGQLVAGVAHEINNPVNFIHGNTIHINQYMTDLLGLLQLYRESFPEPGAEILDRTDEIDLEFLEQDLPKILASIQVGTERIRGIVQSLRTFSRLDEAEVKEVDIHEGIDSTLMILHNRLKAKADHPEIKVVKQYGNLPKIECYAGQLNQVFMNILVNAIDALEDGRETQPISPMITIRTEAIGNKIEIRISDNGPGMSEQVRQRLFDPFFTTKAVGKGTGLGLSISHQIITEKHKGFISCLSAPGEGTVFVIHIPIKTM